MFPSTFKLNQQYGAEFPHVDKVFYSDFSDDPWQRGSVWFSPSLQQPYHLTECPGCGHCMDLGTPNPTDPASLVESRTEFEGYLAQWLDEAAVTAAKKGK